MTARSEPQPEGCDSAVGERSKTYGEFLAYATGSDSPHSGCGSD
jgi:hypothetical protein